jgi:hypothetical protein
MVRSGTEKHTQTQISTMVGSVSSQNLAIALQIFVNQYFSFAWLRKYLLEKRFLLTMGNRDLRFLIQASNDLMFLTRLAYGGFSPATIIPVIFKVLQSIEKDVLRPVSSEIIRPFYFIAEIQTKIKCSPPPLSILWKKVLTVPLDSQKNYCYYLQAKAKELALATPGYGSESDLLSAISHTSGSEELIESFISTDWKIRRSIEAQKSLDHQIKYYQSFSTEAHKNGNYTLCSYWDDVIRKEVNGERSTTDFLITWSIQKGMDTSTRKDRIWRIVAGLLEKPENIPAIKEIFDTVADIEHVFLPFYQPFTASSLLQGHAINCCNLFYEKLSQELSTWNLQNKTSIENMCVIVKKYLFHYFETYISSIEAKHKTLLDFPSLPAFREMIQSKFVEYETELAAYFLALFTRFQVRPGTIMSESDCAEILGQFSYLQKYPDMFFSLPFYHDLKHYTKQLTRGTGESPLYQKAANIACEFLSWFPLSTISFDQHLLRPVTSILDSVYSHRCAYLLTDDIIQLIMDFMEISFELLRSRLIEKRPISEEFHVAICKLFRTSISADNSNALFSNNVTHNNWKKIITLMKKLVVVDNFFFYILIEEVVGDLVQTGTSKKEEDVLQILLLSEQKNYFCCGLHIFKLILPEEKKTIIRLLQNRSAAVDPVISNPTVKEQLQSLFHFTLTKVFHCCELERILIFSLFRVFLAVFKQQSYQQTKAFPTISHWEEIIRFPDNDISDNKKMQEYIDFLVELESKNMLTHFPQDSLSIICRHMLTDLKTLILDETKEATAYRTLQWKGRQVIQKALELLITLSQQSVKTKKGEEEKLFIIECVNLAVFIFRSIDTEVGTDLIKKDIQAEIRRQPRLKRIFQP